MCLIKYVALLERRLCHVRSFKASFHRCASLLLHGVVLWAVIVKGAVVSRLGMWLVRSRPSSDGVGIALTKQRAQSSPMPLQILQMIGSYLEVEDVAAARLVSKMWREQLSAQVARVQLPSHLWQYNVPGQLYQLYRLLDMFRYLKHVQLNLDTQQPVHAWSVGHTMDTFRTFMPTLQGLELLSITQPPHWRAILCNMQCLSPQLTSLSLQDICWPPANTLHLLASYSRLQQLEIRSPHFSRLETQHLQAVGMLTQLCNLTVSFRTVDGTGHEPLRLDPLSSLTRLTALSVQYTGLLELASAVLFCSPVSLAALSNLRQLNVSLVPMPSLVGLQQLPNLHSLVLSQVQPLTSHQCSTLARCQQLRNISLSSVQWSDIAELALLTGLRSLAIQVFQPPRGSLPGVTVGQQLLQLRQLGRLRSLKVKGQCDLSAELLSELARHFVELTSLDLCCLLPDGTQGLQHFTKLRNLKVQPYKWDVWSSEPPVLLYPSLLPASLTSLEGVDVWCLGEAAGSAASLANGGAGSCSSVSCGLHPSNSYNSFTGFWTSMSSVGRDLCSLGNASGFDTGASSSSTAEAKAAGVISCCGGSSLFPVPRSTAAAAEVNSSQVKEALLLNTPLLQRFVMRSTSPFDRRLLLPDLSRCNQLEYLELHHSQLNQNHLQHIAVSCPSSLRTLKLVAVDDGARIRASGLTVLTRLTALTDLSVHAHERAINKNVRKAIASMSQLRSLTLLTSPDYPTHFARGLACLTQLTNLAVLRVGLGFGALDALRRLGAHVSRALPHCTYEMLMDVCQSE